MATYSKEFKDKLIKLMLPEYADQKVHANR